MFSLVEVGDISILVNAPPEIPGSRTVSTPPTDETDFEVMSIEPGGSDVERCVGYESVGLFKSPRNGTRRTSIHDGQNIRA